VTVSRETRRRALLAGASAVAAAAAFAGVAQAAEPHADAELLAVCAAFDATEHKYRRLFYGPARIVDDDERALAQEPIYAEQERLLEPLCRLRATTLDGFRARARTLALWAPDLLVPDETMEPTTDERMVAALLRDMTA